MILNTSGPTPRTHRLCRARISANSHTSPHESIHWMRRHRRREVLIRRLLRPSPVPRPPVTSNEPAALSHGSALIPKNIKAPGGHSKKSSAARPRPPDAMRELREVVIRTHIQGVIVCKKAENPLPTSLQPAWESGDMKSACG